MPFVATMVAIAITTAVTMTVSVALNAIMKAIQGNQSDQQGRTVSYREAAAARRVIYGACRVGAVPTFLHLSASPNADHPNQYLCVVYTICGHEINALTATVFDGVAVTWGGWNVNPRMPLFYQENGIYAGQLWGDWKLGKPCEPAFPGMVAITTRDSSGLWTSAHRQDGCASVALVLSWNSDRFPNGPPAVSFDVQGKKLYDPRTGTTHYTNNSALAIYDFLTNKEYGYGCDPASEINTASVIAAANSCDENVSLKAGGYEHRYQTNGMFQADAQPGDILKQLADSMAGYVTFSQGQWYLTAGVWQSPSVHLTDDDMRAPAQFRTLTPKRELCNAVRGTFYAALRNWQQVDFPPVVHPEHICDDSGYPNAVQRGEWASGTAYSVGDCTIDSSARVLTGPWKPGTVYHLNDYVTDVLAGVTSVYVCIQAHTSSAAGANPPTANGNEPGVGQSTPGTPDWSPYWVDVTATYSEFRGGVYICTVAHTSTAMTQPGIGAHWLSYWIEAKEYIWKDLQLNYTTSSPMAQRIAKIELERTRNQTQGVLKCKLGAFQLQPGDTFYHSHPRFGWIDKVFTVLQSDFVLDDQGGATVLGIDLKVQEASPTTYAWDPETEEQDLGQPSQPTMPDTEIPRATPAAYGPGVTWTAYTDHINFVWDYSGGNAIILLDQENTEYTPVGSQNVTGLSTDTAYKFFPYYSRGLAVFSGLLSDGIGTPAWLQDGSATAGALRADIAEISRAGNVPLCVGPLDASTTASGSGGGGGGGDGGCLRVGMFVEEVDRGPIRCEDLKVGEHVLSHGGRWVEVLKVERRTHDLWAALKFTNGAELTVTSGHPFTLALREPGAMKRAAQLSLEDAVFTPTGIAFPESITAIHEDADKIPITVEDPHTFYASADGENWVLTHNIQRT